MIDTIQDVLTSANQPASQPASYRKVVLKPLFPRNFIFPPSFTIPLRLPHKCYPYSLFYASLSFPFTQLPAFTSSREMSQCQTRCDTHRKLPLPQQSLPTSTNLLLGILNPYWLGKARSINLICQTRCTVSHGKNERSRQTNKKCGEREREKK